MRSRPGGETVQVTFNGASQPATLDGNDDFSISFATGTLGVTASPYTISFSYGGDANFDSATSSSLLTVIKATPLFSGLSAPTIVFGTASTTISGHLNPNAGSQKVPAGETVQITINGVNHNATLEHAKAFLPSHRLLSRAGGCDHGGA